MMMDVEMVQQQQQQQRDTSLVLDYPQQHFYYHHHDQSGSGYHNHGDNPSLASASASNSNSTVVQQATDDLLIAENRSLLEIITSSASTDSENALPTEEQNTDQAAATTGETTTTTTTTLEDLRTERSTLLRIWKGFMLSLVLIFGLWVHAFATGSLISFVISTVACIGFNTALERQGDNFDRMWLRLDEIEVRIRAFENGDDTGGGDDDTENNSNNNIWKDRQNRGVPDHVQRQWQRFVFQRLENDDDDTGDDNDSEEENDDESNDQSCNGPSCIECISMNGPMTRSSSTQQHHHNHQLEHHRHHHHEQDDEYDHDVPCCSICLCDFEHNDVLVRLPCGHEFHDSVESPCIQPWIQRHSRCPLCNSDLSQATATTIQ